MLKDFINLLFLKPEESFKEIFEAINMLENKSSNLYFVSFKHPSLNDLLKYDKDVEKQQEEVNKLKEIINNILKENENINLKIIINLLGSSFLTLISFALIMTNIPLLISILIFLINFLIAYRFAYLSDSFMKVSEKDKRNGKIALNELQRIENILHNTKRNILKSREDKKESTYIKDLDLFNKAQEILNNYFDNNIILPMDSDTIIYLIKMLQSDLKTDECDLMKLLEMTKQNNNSKTLKRTK